MNKAERKQAIIKREQLKDPTLTDEQAYEVYIERQRRNGAKAKTTFHGFRDIKGLAKKAAKKSWENR